MIVQEIENRGVSSVISTVLLVAIVVLSVALLSVPLMDAVTQTDDEPIIDFVVDVDTDDGTLTITHAGGHQIPDGDRLRVVIDEESHDFASDEHVTYPITPGDTFQISELSGGEEIQIIAEGRQYDFVLQSFTLPPIVDEDPIDGEPSFVVTELEPEVEGVAEGETVGFDVTVSNEGDTTGEQDVELVVNGEIVDSERVGLDSGDSWSGRLEFTPDESHSGETGAVVPVAALTDNSSETAIIVVFADVDEVSDDTTEDVYSSGDLTVDGNSDLAVNLTSNGNIDVQSNVNIEGNVTSGNDSNVDSNVEIYGTIESGGDVSISSNVDVYGDIIADGDVTIASNVNIYGDVRSGGNVDTANNVVVHGEVVSGGSNSN